MSSYTTELRFICETLAGLSDSTGYNNILDVIKKSRSLIFDFEYPIFDDNYKEILETNFILNFYTREIGLETYGLWKMKLMSKFRMKMPYFNKLYSAIMSDFNPLNDTNIEKTFIGDIKASISQDITTNENINSITKQNRSSNAETTDQNENTHWDLFQDTPQGGLSGIENLNYLTSARKETDENTGKTTNNNSTNSTENSDSTANRLNKTTGSTTNNESSTEILIGKRNNKSYAELLYELKNKLFSVDEYLMNEMDSLFMQYYGGFYFWFLHLKILGFGAKKFYLSFILILLVIMRFYAR